MGIHSDLHGKRVLITGERGFTGKHVVSVLEGLGAKVSGLNTGGDPSNVNLLDAKSVARRVSEVEPELVLHLAGVSFAMHEDVREIYDVNIIGTRNLLKSLSELPAPPRQIVLASSANVYGPASGLLTEDAKLRPQNDYAVSKLAMESIADIWRERLPIVVARPFNYTGVGQDSKFLVPKIVDHFKRKETEIELGNTHVFRDFSDVRFVAEVYSKLLATRNCFETVNICSGSLHSIDEVIGMMQTISGLEIQVRVNPAFVRAGEALRFGGDGRKLSELIALPHQFPLCDTLRWMYEAR